MSAKTYVVEFTKFAAKQLPWLPPHVREAVHAWKCLVERIGLPEAMKNKGYHDEPLQGQRHGQRSVRLSRSYRLFYRRDDRGEVVVVGVLEVNKHGY